MSNRRQVQDTVAGLSQQSTVPAAVCAVRLSKSGWDRNLALSLLCDSDPLPAAPAPTAGPPPPPPSPPLEASPGAPPAGWCAVCQDDIGADETVMCCFRSRCPRHHFFHAHCLQPWVQQFLSSKQSPPCPVCRGPVLRPAGYALWQWRLVFDALGEAGPAWEAVAAAALRRARAGAAPIAPPPTCRPSA
eukprot:EG_transcript_28874